jgi:hypothetical protein
MKDIQPEIFSETEIIYNKEELKITVRDENCSTDIKCAEDDFDECVLMLTAFVSPESAISADASDICVLNSEENTVFMLKGDFTGKDCVTEAIKRAFDGQEKVKNVGILFEVSKDTELSDFNGMMDFINGGSVFDSDGTVIWTADFIEDVSVTNTAYVKAIVF